MDSFGAYLKSQREQKGIRLEEIASITKIQLSKLKDLEQDRFDRLPPDPFLRGFIVAYAKYVGLDAVTCIEKYFKFKGIDKEEAQKALLEHSTAHAADLAPSEIISRRQPIQRKNVLWTIAIALILVLGVGLIYIGKRNAPSVTIVSQEKPILESATPADSISPLDSAALIDNSSLPNDSVAGQLTGKANSQPKVESNPSPPKEATKEANKEVTPLNESMIAQIPKAEAGTKHQVHVISEKRTWMKIVVDGESPKEFFLKDGSSVTYSAKEKIKLVLGNAKTCTVFYNGEPIPGKLYGGTVGYFIYPADAKFPQDAPPQREVTTEKESTSSTKGNLLDVLPLE